MKMFLVAAVLAFAPFVHAAPQDQPQQDQAAVCSAQMDQNQELSPVCEQRLACQMEGVQNAECQQYCAANSTDIEACTATQDLGATALPIARACYWRGHVRVCVGRDHWRHGWCRWRDRFGRCHR